MICEENSRLSILFTESGKLLEPVEGRFTYGKDKYDFLQASFNATTSSAIGEAMDENLLASPELAVVRVNEEPVRRMYYDPEHVELGTDVYDDAGGFIELHDLHETLKEGTVNYTPDGEISLEEVYTEIFNSRVKEGYFSGLRIEAPNKIIEDNSKVTLPLLPDSLTPEDGVYLFGLGELQTVESPLTKEAIYFDEISPLEAVKQANKQLGVTTHVDSQGNLVVGAYKSEKTYTASEPGEEADFHIEGSAITGDAGSIQTLIIDAGNQVDLSGMDTSQETLGRHYNSLNPFTDDSDKGYRVQIIVNNRDGVGGEVIKTKRPQLGYDDYVTGALNLWQTLQSQYTSGSVTLNGTTSNVKRPVTIADNLLVAEPDPCGLIDHGGYPGGNYFATGVTHTFGNSWQMEVDLLQNYSTNPNIEIDVLFNDPTKDEVFTHEDLYGYEYGEKDPND